MESLLSNLGEKIGAFEDKVKLVETQLTNLNVEKKEIIHELSETCIKIKQAEIELQLKEDFLKTYGTLEQVIDKVSIKPPMEITATNKKCRYYNRGYCKKQDAYKFDHPPSICQTFLKHEQCQLRQCQERHPKNCRYWSNSDESYFCPITTRRHEYNTHIIV